MLVSRAFQRSGLNHSFCSVPSGEEAIAYFKGDFPYSDRIGYPLPVMVLLDIKLTGTNGFDVLRWVRRQPQFGKLCIVMLTNSDQIRDVNYAYSLGANSFLVKPLDFWNAAELLNSLEHLLARAA
jgi:CheY-like chemotaxis protein